MNEIERYWYMNAKSAELTQELNGDLRVIRLTEPNGDAACSTFWELTFRSISSGGKLYIPPNTKYGDINAAIAAMIGRNLAETQDILRVLVRYEYLVPYPGGYVIPLVVKNLGKLNTPGAQQRQEARWKDKGEARLSAVLTALGLQDYSDSEKDAESAAHASYKREKKPSATEKQKRDTKNLQHGPALGATDQGMEQYVQLIKTKLSVSGQTGQNWDKLLSLIMELLNPETDPNNHKD